MTIPGFVNAILSCYLYSNDGQIPAMLHVLARRIFNRNLNRGRLQYLKNEFLIKVNKLIHLLHHIFPH